MDLQNILRAIVGRHPAKAEAAGSPPRTGSDLIRVEGAEGRRVPWGCGHEFSERFRIVAYGEVLEQKDPHFFMVRPCCGACTVRFLKEESIRCGRCGRIIRPEDPCSLYPNPPEFRPQWATGAFDGILCCMRRDCVLSPYLYAGEWSVRGFRPRYEGRTQFAQYIKTGERAIAPPLR